MIPRQPQSRNRVPLLACKQCPDTHRAPRRAFTLIELLVVITIIGMLAGMSLGALYLARDSARKAKTQATIAKLDDIIQTRYNEFLTRRLPIKNRRIPPDAMAELRFRVLHEIARMEMPDRLTDITYPKNGAIDPSDIDASFMVRCSTFNRNGSPPGIVSLDVPVQRTPLARRFHRQAVPNADVANNRFLNGTGDKWDSAECLYMIVQTDPEARERFQDNEIGDLDGDGFFEFIDGWGHPILFLRWAPGFRSEIQTGDAEKDHDPFDPRRIGEWVEAETDVWERPADTTCFRLVPLIYSAGPDGVFGLEKDEDWTYQYSNTDSDYQAIDRLWTYLNTDTGVAIGAPYPPAHPAHDGHLDNITNHSLGMN